MYNEDMLMCQTNVVLLVLHRKGMLMYIVLIAVSLSNFFLGLYLYPYEAQFVLKLLRDKKKTRHVCQLDISMKF
jgi:hypothetical protein